MNILKMVYLGVKRQGLRLRSKTNNFVEINYSH